MAAGSPFFDLPRILRLRAILGEVDPSGPPSAREIAKFDKDRPCRLALLPGSFNPPTDAHIALADLALASGRVDALSYVLASRTVNKERIEGASLADRLICLSELVEARPRQGVLLVNRGLYVDQAELVRQMMPDLDELWFVVGYDKIVQIFDPRYYQDRDAALDRLFGLASFLVSTRAPARPQDLDDFLARPENRSHAAKVVRLDLPPRYQVLSSTQAREATRHGEASPTFVPPIVIRFIHDTGAYEQPVIAPDGEKIDRYAIREGLVEAVERGQLAVIPNETFRIVVDRLSAADADGRRRREALRRGDVSAAVGMELE
jgi:nicotinamide-nucleotide adenylyltransferase